MKKQRNEENLKQPHRVTVVFELPHGNYEKLINDIKSRYKTYSYYFVEKIIPLTFSRAPEVEDGEEDF